MTRKRVWLLNLAAQTYDEAHSLQLALVDLRQRDLVEDVLLLLEHTPVITLGRRADPSHILASQEWLDREGIEVQRVERGGDVTYHGPGQLVGYPILKLCEYDGLGASDYMHRLEDVLAAALSYYGLHTYRREGVIGVWVGDSKIAALGVRIRRGVTFHGFALNVASDMSHWATIIPCGITDGGVTSMSLELDTAPALDEVRQQVAACFAKEFDVELCPTTAEALLAFSHSSEHVMHAP